MPIHFNNHEINFNLKNKAAIKNWIATVIKKEKLSPGNIAYVFCSDEYLHSINVKFLKHDTLTDIITFDYNEAKTVNGEIYISIDRVKENASEFNVSFDKELQRVMIHGILHLCGYKDKGKAALELMRKKEDASLKLLGKDAKAAPALPTGQAGKTTKGKYCCETMSVQCEHVCETHKDPFDCPDRVIYKSGKKYGLIIHDGGSSCYAIVFCPWCGSKL